MNRLMTHVVAGYPDAEKCVDLMRGMEKAGVSMIEVQIPFSDPIADGETIMRANDTALKNNMTVEKSFKLITDAACNIDVYVMSYFQKIFSYDIDKFCELAQKTGVKGLIVPDLPYDAPEFEEFMRSLHAHNLIFVPVISPGMTAMRLENAMKNTDKLVYLTSMKGITGKKLQLNEELAEAAETIKELMPHAELAVGFGVSSRYDLQKILNMADIGIVGSSVMRKIDSGGTSSALNFVQELIDS